MRTVLFLVQKEFLQIRRNRLLLPLILVMPLVQMILLSYAANYEIKNIALNLFDQDHSSASRGLADKFSASGYFQLKSVAFSAQQSFEALEADRADLSIEIPSGFERQLMREGRSAVMLTANAINPVKAGLAMGYASEILNSYNIQLMEKWFPLQGRRRIEVVYSNWYNPKLDYKSFMVPGILGELVALIICFLTALNIVRERELGTIEQINVTPVKRWQFILGKLLPFWLLSLVMMGIGLLAGRLIFDIPMLGPIWLVFVYTMVFTPCMLGLGFLISNFAETQQQAMFTAWFFLLIFILMCGLFTPVDSMPQWAQWINKLNPVQYFVEFMRLVLLKGASFHEVRANLFSVAAYALTANVLAIWTYKKRA